MKFLNKLFSRPEETKISCTVIIVAAGSARRMEGIDKILLPLANVPILIHSLLPFEETSLVQELIVVTREENLVEVAKLCKEYSITKVSKVIPGGETRMRSVLAGLNEVKDTVGLIAIHDGARPFITREVLEKAIRKAAEFGAAAPAVPIKDTVKLAKDGVVKKTLQRNELFAIQTPQVFEAALIKGAISKALEDEVALTDDCSAVERLGMTVALTQGSNENIKITTPTDLYIGEAILMGRENQ